MDDDRLIELLRLLVPAPEDWVAEAHEIAVVAPPDDEGSDDGGAHDQDRADTDERRVDFGDADEPGEPDRAPEDDETDPWSV